jgi:hypothetical protein
MTKEISPSLWWSIPQAIIWIVTRSETEVSRASGSNTISSLRRVIGIRPLSDRQEPPVSLAAAPNDLLRAWQATHITLYGREWGKGRSRSIPTRSGLHLRDYRGEVCLGAPTLYFDTSRYWSNLYVRPDDCKRRWPAVLEQTAEASRPLAPARHSTDSEVLAFLEGRREALRAERKRAGRDVLLRAAMDHFGLSRKVALDIWNSAARDRKGGRPKTAKARQRYVDLKKSR